MARMPMLVPPHDDDNDTSDDEHVLFLSSSNNNRHSNNNITNRHSNNNITATTTLVDTSGGEDAIKKERYERGQCPSCGQQLFELKENHNSKETHTTKPKFGLLFRHKATASTNDNNNSNNSSNPPSSSSSSPQQRAPPQPRRLPLTIPGRVERGQCVACSETGGTNMEDVPPPPIALPPVTALAAASIVPSLSTTTTNAATAIYDGPLNEYGERHGEGIMTWSNGDRYVGTFFNGVRHGHGSLFFAGGVNGEYVGQWECNYMHGMGTRRFANGDVYVGMYVDGQRNGSNGRFYYANGDLYVGDWQNDQMTGKGRYYYSSGQRFEGRFVQGKRFGKGKLQRVDGSLDIFLYDQDQRVGTGIRWSVDRKRAWKLDRHGNVKKKLSIAEAVSAVYEMEALDPPMPTSSSSFVLSSSPSAKAQNMVAA